MLGGPLRSVVLLTTRCSPPRWDQRQDCLILVSMLVDWLAIVSLNSVTFVLFIYHLFIS